MLTKKGKLYVVATPIGNLQDITLRALETLKRVDVVVAEDTRHVTLLLKHFSLDKPTISLHSYNEKEKSQLLIKKIKEGLTIALVSDAGTPLISDPGFLLVKLAANEDISVIPIPGPCALITALSVAGLPATRFAFEGFLPTKTQARKKRLSEFAHENRTMIFYEAPHRLLASLKDMADTLGESRNAVVARELTKIHESILRNDLKFLVNYYQNHIDEIRGEVVILVSGCDKTEEADNISNLSHEKVLNLLLEALPLKQAVNLTSKITGVRKNLLYGKALNNKK